MRIRTSGKNAHRKETIESLSAHYGVNQTRALLLAADQVPSLHSAVATVLDRDDLSTRQKREIAETFSQARGLDVDYQESMDLEIAD